MEKYKQIKRNHHYIWGYYLKNWAVNNNIYYISKKGKIAFDSVKGLAKETDFYKINLLDSKDIDFIKILSSESSSELQRIHMLYLNNFVNLSNTVHILSQSELDKEEFQFIQNNSLEDLHSDIENLAVNVISDLARGDLSTLNSTKNMLSFCNYLGHQIARTKAIKESSLLAIQKSSSIEINLLGSDHLSRLWEKNWWFLSFMFGINLGYDFYNSKEKNNHIFIHNTTTQDFITSDNPIINVHASLDTLSKDEPPLYADFYIPLSPRYAYMINDSSSYNHLSTSISIDEVNKFNKLIYNKSNKTVFGNSDTILKKLKTL